MNHQALIDYLIAMGHQELVDQLQKIKPQNPLQDLILAVALDVMIKHGKEGANLLKDKIVRLLDGETKVDLDLSNLRLADDMLAAMEQMEGEQKAALKDWITKVVETLEPVLVGLVRVFLQ